VMPDLTIDRAGRPRVVSTATTAPADQASQAGEVRITRCTAAPCTNAANWTTTTVIASGNLATFAPMPNGRSAVLTESAGRVTAAVETGNDYSVQPLNLCGGPLNGATPAGYLTAGDRWRVIRNVTANNDEFYAAPY
jgi:hypothetical protein